MYIVHHKKVTTRIKISYRLLVNKKDQDRENLEKVVQKIKDLKDYQ